MTKTIQGYPFSVLVDAFRSGLLVVLGPFIALYCATLFTSFVAWQLPDPVYFIASPIWSIGYWAAHLTAIWVWIPMLILLGSMTAYTILPAIRFDLLLLVAVAGLYLNVFTYDPEDLPGTFSIFYEVTTIIPIHYDHLPGLFVARLIFVTIAVGGSWIASLRAVPWKVRVR